MSRPVKTLGVVAVLMLATGCAGAEKVDDEAYSSGEDIAEVFIGTAQGASFDDLAVQCEGARDALRESGQDSENVLFSYVLGCKDRLREEFDN